MLSIEANDMWDKLKLFRLLKIGLEEIEKL